MRAEGRVALVTGAGRGLGVAIARALAARGHRVALGYRTSREAAERLARELGGALAVELDAAQERSVGAALARVREELGALDVLVNNGAIAQEKPFLELDDADWETMLSVNLLGPVRLARAALPEMLERGFGRIVNVASIGGQWGGFHQVHYAAAKAGLINLTRSLAKLYSARGVTCNAVSPGLVATDMSRRELESEEGRRKTAGIPAGRLGTPEEVGAAVAYLVSDEAAYVTGQTLNLNGGMHFS